MQHYSIINLIKCFSLCKSVRFGALGTVRVFIPILLDCMSFNNPIGATIAASANSLVPCFQFVSF